MQKVPVVKTKNIYLQGSKEAVLLLHSFTSTANEMRNVAKHLHNEGYTCLAINYRGHGESPERLFQSSVEEAWQTASDALQFLVDEGYESISIVGQSLGGVMALRLAQHPACRAIGVISSPVMERPLDELQLRVIQYAKRYYRFEQKSEAWIESFIAQHFPRPNDHYTELQQFIIETKDVVPTITKPVLLCKGALDDQVYQNSIDYIAEHVASRMVKVCNFENSGHLITLGKQRELLHAELVAFLNEALTEKVAI